MITIKSDHNLLVTQKFYLTYTDTEIFIQTDYGLLRYFNINGVEEALINYLFSIRYNVNPIITLGENWLFPPIK